MLEKRKKGPDLQDKLQTIYENHRNGRYDGQKVQL